MDRKALTLNSHAMRDNHAHGTMLLRFFPQCSLSLSLSPSHSSFPFQKICSTHTAVASEQQYHLIHMCHIHDAFILNWIVMQIRNKFYSCWLIVVVASPLHVNTDLDKQNKRIGDKGESEKDQQDTKHSPLFATHIYKYTTWKTSINHLSHSL